MLFKLERPDVIDIQMVMAANKGLDGSKSTHLFPGTASYFIVDEKDIPKLIKFHPDGESLAAELTEYIPPVEEI